MRTANDVGRRWAAWGDAGFTRFRGWRGETGDRGAGAADRRHRKRLVQRLHHRRGYHGRGAGQQHLPVVRRFLQGGRQAHVKFGARVHLDQVNIDPNAMYNGSFLFQGTETGSDFADFLLGIASSYAQGDSRHFYLRNQYAGLYGQDSWRVRPNLTLNYGVRWDLLPPWREKFNQLQTLVRGQQSVVYPGAPAGWFFPATRGFQIRWRRRATPTLPRAWEWRIRRMRRPACGRAMACSTRLSKDSRRGS